MEVQLKQFTETILGITPRNSTLLGDMPRIGGTWAGSQGAMGPGGGNVLYELKQHVADFRQSYNLGDRIAYTRIAQDIKGLLLVTQTLGVLAIPRLRNSLTSCTH